MKGKHVSIRSMNWNRLAPAHVIDRSNAVQDLFVELVQVLERLRDCPEASSGGQSMERWEDGEFIYLETDLRPIFDSEIDINVHDGRVYVRLER